MEPAASLIVGKRNVGVLVIRGLCEYPNDDCGQAGHISNYYLGEIIQDEEVAAVQAAAEKLGVAVENTRYHMLFQAALFLLTFP